MGAPCAVRWGAGPGPGACRHWTLRPPAVAAELAPELLTVEAPAGSALVGEVKDAAAPAVGGTPFVDDDYTYIVPPGYQYVDVPVQRRGKGRLSGEPGCSEPAD
jgi:hypothetical protein